MRPATFVPAPAVLVSAAALLVLAAAPAAARALHTCRAATCTVDAPAAGLANIPLRRGWILEEPFFYETAGGSRAAVPTIMLRHGGSGAGIVMNGRQVMASLYLCRDRGADTICIQRPVTREGRAMAAALERWRR